MQMDYEKAAYITYEEAQRLTSLGRTTLSSIVNSGEVNAARIGRAVRLDRESLMSYMRRASSGGANPDPDESGGASAPTSNLVTRRS